MVDVFIKEDGKEIKRTIKEHQENKNSKQLTPPTYLNDLLAENFPDALFREDEIKSVLRALSKRRTANALLTGDPGVGKTAIVEGLATKIKRHDLDIPFDLQTARLFELDIQAMLSDSRVGLNGGQEKLMRELISFLESQENAIVFIDEIHRLSPDSTTKDTAYVKIGENLKPLMSRSSKIKFIGATTSGEAKVTIFQDRALQRRFEEVKINELSNAETVQVLKSMITSQEAIYKVKFPEDDEEKNAILEYLVAQGDNNFPTFSNPDLSISLLDSVFSLVKTNNAAQMNKNILSHVTPSEGIPFVSKDDVDDVIEERLNFKPKTVIPDLKEKLKARIIGQDDAVDEIADSINTNLASLRPTKRPLSFFIAGPTGTGKTEIANAISNILFDGVSSVIEINMTEYAVDNADPISKLLGLPKGYKGSDTTVPRPLDPLRENPFSVVIINEFEKGAQQVQQVFMEALDAGQITDAQQNIINFSKAIVIATSNAGFTAQDMIQEHVTGFSGTDYKDSDGGKLGHVETRQEVFDKLIASGLNDALLNRFSDLITFKTLTRDDFAKILDLNIESLLKDIKNSHPEVSVEISDEHKQKLVNDYFDESRNGRAVRSAVEYLERQISNNITRKEINLKVEKDNVR
jgi:ATP-dependent Clp protease ATP-binding subunit ClpA